METKYSQCSAHDGIPVFFDAQKGCPYCRLMDADHCKQSVSEPEECIDQIIEKVARTLERDPLEYAVRMSECDELPWPAKALYMFTWIFGGRK